MPDPIRCHIAGVKFREGAGARLLAMSPGVPLTLEAEEDRSGLWCVCWFGEVEDVGFKSHKGPVVTRAEAEKRMARQMKVHPTVIFWLERA